ncbi:disabled homolog 2-like isoform X2 [Lineus longissimus]|uniref:disabled homolog 2-like isoform X2 n=2 Tax=Lineus longissimus TaxID=88925 RepID=UPI00315D18E9
MSRILKLKMSAEEKPDELKTSPKKQEKGKPKKDKLDPARFHGDGVLFKAKLIGTEDVPEARGDKICQEAMTKLKAALKSQGGHKQRLNIYVSLDGMKIYDEKSSKLIHHHAVHRVSFISRDVGDTRAFGYVCGDGDGHHKFFGIKTEKAAEHLVLTLRDLFQVVFELKKKEVELAKKAKENNNEVDASTNAEEPVYEVPKGCPREITIVATGTPRDDPDSHIYEVPKSNAAVAVSKPDSGIGTLLDLETELASLSQGIAQMDAFSDPFSTTFDSPPSTNANTQLNGTPRVDVWGSPQPQPGITLTAHAQASPTTGAWDSHPQQPAPTLAAQAHFPPLAAQTNPDPFVVPRQPGAIPVLPTPPRPVATSHVQPVSNQSTPSATMSAFPPVTSTVNAPFGEMSTPKAPADPFEADPFFSSTPATKPQEGDKYAVFQDLSLDATAASSVNFNESTMYGSNVTDNTMNNAFATSGNIFDGPTVLQPAVVQPEPQVTSTKGLFDDLNPITVTDRSKPPKEMFAEKMQVPKKSLNEIKVEQRVMTPDFDSQRQPSPNPFGGGGLNASVGFSNDPFQVNTDPFSVQLAGNKSSRDAAAKPFSSDPFSAPPSAQISASSGNADNSSNPFEPDTFTTHDRSNTPTVEVTPPSCPPPTLSKSGPVLCTSDDFDLPSPDAPPPPLPAEVQIGFSDVAPAPPPRPRPKSNQSQLTTKPTDLPKLSPPLPRPRKSLLKSPEQTDESGTADNSVRDAGSSAMVSKTVEPVTDPVDPFASDPFFTSPIPPQIKKPTDDPFAKFDATFPGESVSLSSDSSDPFNMPFDFNTKGQEPLYATVNKQKREVDLL